MWMWSYIDHWHASLDLKRDIRSLCIVGAWCLISREMWDWEHKNCHFGGTTSFQHLCGSSLWTCLGCMYVGRGANLMDVRAIPSFAKLLLECVSFAYASSKLEIKFLWRSKVGNYGRCGDMTWHYTTWHLLSILENSNPAIDFFALRAKKSIRVNAFGIHPGREKIRGKIIRPVNRGAGKSGAGKSGFYCSSE